MTDQRLQCAADCPEAAAPSFFPGGLSFGMQVGPHHHGIRERLRLHHGNVQRHVLHDYFLDEDIKELAADMGMTFDDLKNVVASLHEFNPMMGHRGCRLAVTYPEIAAMQTRAVIKAALNVSAETGCMITPHIMIPLVGEVKELKFVKDVVVKVADELIAAAGVDMKYQVGTMIEIPRAALTAGEIAKEAEFFSFGTNDLTQMTFGFSRDDAAKFLGAYYENKIYESDPFQQV